MWPNNSVINKEENQSFDSFLFLLMHWINFLHLFSIYCTYYSNIYCGWDTFSWPFFSSFFPISCSHLTMNSWFSDSQCSLINWELFRKIDSRHKYIPYGCTQLPVKRTKRVFLKAYYSISMMQNINMDMPFMI